MGSAIPAVAAAALLVLAGCAGVDTVPEPNPGPGPGTTTATTPYTPGVTAEVTASGRVRSLSVTHDRYANSPGSDWTTRATLSDGTAVDPPEWVGDRSARQ